MDKLYSPRYITLQSANIADYCAFYVSLNKLGPILLIWFNFNPSTDK